MGGPGEQVLGLLLEGAGVPGVLRGRVRALDALVHRARQDVRRRLPEQALLPAVEGLQGPGRVVDVLDQPVVAERHPDLQSDGHAHAVLAVEQHAHEAGQVQVADLPHPVLEVALAVQPVDAGDGGAVAVGDIALQVQGLGDVGAQHAGVLAEVAAHGRQPREGVGAARLLVEELEVTAEDLVGGLAGQGHRGLLPDGAEEQQQRAVHVAEARRQVTGPDDLGADGGVGERVGAEHDVLVVGAGEPGHVVHEGRVGGAAQFVGDEVVGLADEVDGEAAHLLALRGELPGGQGGHGRRVESAGEQGAARHVGDELAAHDVVEERAHGGDGGVAVVGVRAGLQAPVHAGGQAGAVDGDDRAGLHLAHAVPEGVARRLDHDEQLAQAVQRDTGPDQRVGEDGLGFRAEEDAVVGGLVVERLDAHAVADHHQLVVAAVPHGERVHAVEPFGDGVAPLQVAVQHDLGVGVGGEPVAAVREFPAQFGEVVGLPGVDEGDGALGGPQGHRLTAAGEVDDGEPAVSQGGGALGPGAAVVRAPAGHRLGHRMQCGGLGRQVTVEGDPSGDAAHALPPASGCPSARVHLHFRGRGGPAGRTSCIEHLYDERPSDGRPSQLGCNTAAATAPRFRPRFAPAKSTGRPATGHRAKRTGHGQKLPQAARAVGRRYGFAVRNESSAPVSSAGFSTGSSWPASRTRTTASG